MQRVKTRTSQVPVEVAGLGVEDGGVGEDLLEKVRHGLPVTFFESGVDLVSAFADARFEIRGFGAPGNVFFRVVHSFKYKV